MGSFYIEPTVETVLCVTLFLQQKIKKGSGVSIDRKALFPFSELRECHVL
jgi:hypothetical protein